MLDNMRRERNPGPGDEYRLPAREAEQLSALLIVTADYARREIGEIGEERRADA